MIPATPPQQSHAAARPQAHSRAPKAEAPHGRFAGVLATLEDADEDAAGDLQDDAADGKALPGTADGSLAWLATMFPPPQPAADAPPRGAEESVALAAGWSGVQAAGDAMPPTVAVPDTKGLVQLAKFAADPSLGDAHGTILIEPGQVTPGGKHAGKSTDPALAITTTPAVPVGEIVQTALPTGKAMPAGELFAAALHAAREDANPPGSKHEPLAAITDTATPAITATAASSGSNDAALDMRDGHWPHTMIDRIERMRDDANASDTRIRLVPDALGSVDVALRREGDTLHVRFDASEAATRAMLTDAQPRLAQIASERGLTLGQSQVGGGNAGDGGNRTPPRPMPVPSRPRSARTEAPTSVDTRIA